MSITRFLCLCSWLLLLQAALATPIGAPAVREDAEDFRSRELQNRLRELQKAWRQAGSPTQHEALGAELFEGAVKADRPDVAEEVVAGGPLEAKMISIPPGGRKVTLRVVKVFPGIDAKLDEETFSSMQRQDGWLARRITATAFEVWTAKRGWLFDASGKLLNEAHPPRTDGWGREWYGAFLPDGQWVTTQLSEPDSDLSFFSAKGKLLRVMTCDDLAPRPPDAGAKLLGWGRSDKDGAGWVVNVGSENGYATVWVGPDGPARVLRDGERWQLCYPRALGPRGSAWEMSVSEDADRRQIKRTGAGHGSWVGYPEYSVTDAALSTPFRAFRLPGGNYLFGFWPHGEGVFFGSERDLQGVKSADTRKVWHIALPTTSGGVWENSGSVVDRTWFFSLSGELKGWLRGRRLADAADGAAMLFRMTSDSRIVTLRPDLTAAAARRMVWSDGAVADAVALWDDLRLGLFVRRGRLVLAAWDRK